MLKHECRLAIIHNHDRHDTSTEFEKLSLSMGADYYVRRRNKGFDIGALKDVSDGVIKSGEFNPELLQWCVDDSLPMRRDSVVKFRDFLLQENVGIVGSQNSHECNLHMRTNAFMIRMETIRKIKFPCERSVNMYKDHCFDFEHGKCNLKHQVEAMNLKAVQASMDVNYYFWDTGHLARYNLWDRYYKEFGEIQ